MTEGNKSPEKGGLISAELFLFLACASASYATLQALQSPNPILVWIVTTYYVIPLAANALIAIISGYSLLRIGYALLSGLAESEVMYELVEKAVVALFFLLFASAVFSDSITNLHVEPMLQAVYAHTIMSLIFLTLSVSKKQKQESSMESKI